MDDLTKYCILNRIDAMKEDLKIIENRIEKYTEWLTQASKNKHDMLKEISILEKDCFGTVGI